MFLGTVSAVKEYEVDELCTYVNSNKIGNRVWVTYPINKESKAVMGLNIGARSKIEMRPVTEILLDLFRKKMYTINGALIQL
ncbi:MAG: insertion element IS1 protein InsB [Saprospiraceae bacterium]|jgi:insertion element IS1 protein InsB